MELTAYEQEEKANREAWKEMRKLTPYAQEVNAKREAWKEMGKLRKRIAELEKERDSLLRLIGYVKSIVFSKVECSYASFKRPLEELLKEKEGGS